LDIQIKHKCSGPTQVWTLPRTEGICVAGLLCVKIFDYLLCHNASGLIHQNPLAISWIFCYYLPYVFAVILASNEYSFLIDCVVECLTLCLIFKPATIPGLHFVAAVESVVV